MVEQVMRPGRRDRDALFHRPHHRVLPVFALRLSWNAGMSFSLFNSGEAVTTALLLAVASVVTLFAAVVAAPARPALVQVASGLIIGGALGNIVDRRFMAVLRISWISTGVVHFPTSMWRIPASASAPAFGCLTRSSPPPPCGPHRSKG